MTVKGSQKKKCPDAEVGVTCPLCRDVSPSPSPVSCWCTEEGCPGFKCMFLDAMSLQIALQVNRKTKSPWYLIMCPFIHRIPTQSTRGSTPKPKSQNCSCHVLPRQQGRNSQERGQTSGSQSRENKPISLRTDPILLCSSWETPGLVPQGPAEE